MDDLPPCPKPLTGTKRGRAGSASGGAVRAPARSGVNHVVTERRRRDRINAGFDELRKVIPTEDTKVDKAAFLHISVDYIRNLQALLQRAIDEGALDNLSEESQWALRMRLPRWDPHSACPKPAPYPKVAAASQLASDHMTAPYPKVSASSHLAAAPAMGRVDNLVEPQPVQAAINMPTVPARAVTNADVDPTMFMATAGACMLNMMQQQQQALLSVLVASQSVKKADANSASGQDNSGMSDVTAMLYLQLLQQQQAMFANPLGALAIQPLQIPALALPCTTGCGGGNNAAATATTCGAAAVDDNDDSGSEDYAALDLARDSGRPAKVRKCSSTAAVLGKTNGPLRPSGMSAGRPGM